MDKLDTSFEENVKIAFKKAKEHNSLLEKELKANREAIISLMNEVKLLKSKIDYKSEQIAENKPILTKNEIVPQETKGSIHSFIHSLGIHSLNIQSEVNNIFKSLTKKEFLTFLTIYQLEEEGIKTTYTAIATKMQLSEGCIRTYITALFRKKVPITKVKQNNKIAVIAVQDSFKKLNLKDKLINMYYNLDPEQKTLNYTQNSPSESIKLQE